MKIRNMERVQAIEVFYDQFNARSLDFVRQHVEPERAEHDACAVGGVQGSCSGEHGACSVRGARPCPGKPGAALGQPTRSLHVKKRCQSATASTCSTTLTSAALARSVTSAVALPQHPAHQPNALPSVAAIIRALIGAVGAARAGAQVMLEWHM